MFETLSSHFEKIKDKLQGRSRITDELISQTSSDVRKALLEADVGLEVVKDFCERFEQQAKSVEVKKSLNAGQSLIKSVKTLLTEQLGSEKQDLNLDKKFNVILLAGLQGSGKTTSCGKLANFLKTKQGKKVAVVSVDTYRPAARQQLAILASQIGIECYLKDQNNLSPVELTKEACKIARKQGVDVLLIDTAGRSQVDKDLMEELAAIDQIARPQERLLVVDAMAGQYALESARSFVNQIQLTGLLISKVDSDARGGSALSAKAVTDVAVKFLATGESVEDLEIFHPDRLASRILGMGDLLSLIEETEEKFDKTSQKEQLNKLKKGNFTFEDYLKQMQAVEKMGKIENVLQKIPGIGRIDQKTLEQGKRTMQQTKAVIQSMTPLERIDPDIIKTSRKARIAKGSGTDTNTVNQVLRQFTQAKQMMQSATKQQVKKQTSITKRKSSLFGKF